MQTPTEGLAVLGRDIVTMRTSVCFLKLYKFFLTPRSLQTTALLSPHGTSHLSYGVLSGDTVLKWPRDKYAAVSLEKQIWVFHTTVHVHFVLGAFLTNMLFKKEKDGRKKEKVSELVNIITSELPSSQITAFAKQASLDTEHSFELLRLYCASALLPFSTWMFSSIVIAYDVLLHHNGASAIHYLQ